MCRLRTSMTLGAVVLTALIGAALVGLPVGAQTSDASVSLRKSADCMYEILTTTPGVREPKLSYATREGWTHPVLEYRAEETNRWVQPTHFEAKKRDDDRYYFFARVPGIIDPAVGHFDIHVTDAVVEKWKTQCHAEVVVESD
jgi:hypothetical protein